MFPVIVVSFKVFVDLLRCTLLESKVIEEKNNHEYFSVGNTMYTASIQSIGNSKFKTNISRAIANRRKNASSHNVGFSTYIGKYVKFQFLYLLKYFHVYLLYS